MALSKCRLPPELLLQVVESVGEDGTFHSEARVPLNAAQTKTLVAFTLVCRATYKTATRVLRMSCLNFWDEHALMRFLRTADSETDAQTSLPPEASTSGYRAVRSLALAPHGNLGAMNYAATNEIFYALRLTQPSLRSLLIEVPGELQPFEDTQVMRATLYESLSHLEAIEVYFGLGKVDATTYPWRPLVWASWQHLRVLGLDGGTFAMRRTEFWQSIAQLEKLEVLVLMLVRITEMLVDLRDHDFLTYAEERLERRLPLTIFLSQPSETYDDPWDSPTTYRWRERDPDHLIKIALLLDEPEGVYAFSCFRQCRKGIPLGLKYRCC